MGEAGNRRLKLKFTNDSLTFTIAIHGKNNNPDLKAIGNKSFCNPQVKFFQCKHIIQHVKLISSIISSWLYIQDSQSIRIFNFHLPKQLANASDGIAGSIGNSGSSKQGLVSASSMPSPRIFRIFAAKPKRICVPVNSIIAPNS